MFSFWAIKREALNFLFLYKQLVKYVNNISFSLREDGGFDCTTELLAQGVNILDSVLEQDNRNVNEVKKGLIEKIFGGVSSQPTIPNTSE